MRIKLVLFTILLGIAVGLLTGILDSAIHQFGLQQYKLLSIIVFLIFFFSVYFAAVFYRNNLTDGYLNYWQSYKLLFFIGSISSFIIGILRFVYLKYIAVIDIQEILERTEKTMLDHYSTYPDELVTNRLSFIEFSYDPVISSLFYIIYYLLHVLVFTFIGAAILRRIDRNIAI